MTTPSTAAAGSSVSKKDQGAVAKAIKGEPDDRTGAGWFVKGMLLLISTIWLIPTVGLLVNSFRSRAATNSSGWWTRLGDPAQFTVGNYG